MKRTIQSSFITLLLVATCCMAVLTGCQCTVPSAGNCGCGPCVPAGCQPYGHLPQLVPGPTVHHFFQATPAVHVPIRIIPIQPGQPVEESAALSPDERTSFMTLSYTPTNLLSRAYRGIATMIAETAQFQIETGENAATSLQDYCHWPEWYGDNPEGDLSISLPMAVVSIVPTEDGSLIRSAHSLADLKIHTQLCLAENSALTELRDRADEATDRFVKIMDQMKTLSEDGTERFPVSGWVMHESPARNDRESYRFVDADGDEIRAYVFGAMVQLYG